MIDWEQLEREFADDAGASPARGRAGAAARRREVRQTAVLVLAAVGLLAALLVPLLVIVLPARPPAQSPVRPDTLTARHSSAAERRAQAWATQAAVYAAALGGGSGHERLPRIVWVRDSVCASVPTTPGAASCTDRPIPAQVRRAVRALLGPKLRFATDPPLPHGATGAAVVQFGRLHVTGDRARLGIETVCGPMCGEGETLVLRFRAGHWQVTGTLGPRWVS